MRRQQGRVAINVLAHVSAIVAICLAFYVALALGLQLRPLYGNIGLGLTAVLAVAYVYFGLIRRR